MSVSIGRPPGYEPGALPLRQSAVLPFDDIPRDRKKYIQGKMYETALFALAAALCAAASGAIWV
jgi:hypothetical protein